MNNNHTSYTQWVMLYYYRTKTLYQCSGCDENRWGPLGEYMYVQCINPNTKEKKNIRVEDLQRRIADMLNIPIEATVSYMPDLPRKVKTAYLTVTNCVLCWERGHYAARGDLPHVLPLTCKEFEKIMPRADFQRKVQETLEKQKFAAQGKSAPVKSKAERIKEHTIKHSTLGALFGKG